MHHRSYPPLAFTAALLVALCIRAAARPLDLPADVRTKAEAAAVLIERFDADGKPLGYVSGFVAEPGWVITNWHCMEGVSDAFVNAGKSGLFRITGIIAEDYDHDFVILKPELPEGFGPLLPLAEKRAPRGAIVSIVVRDDAGNVSISDGSLVGERMRYGSRQLGSTAEGWPGCSGSPLVDMNGVVVGVISGGDVDQEDEGARSTGVPAHVVRKAPIRAVQTLREWWQSHSPHHPPGLRRHVDRAREAFHEGDFAGAAEEYRRALALSPGNRSVLHYLASSLEKGGDPAAAVRALTEHAGREPADAHIWQHIGDVHARAEELAEARDAYVQAIELAPSAELHYWLGATHWRLGSRTEARHAFETALELEPRHPHARPGLLYLYCETRETEPLRTGLAEFAADPDSKPEVIAGVAEWAIRYGQRDAVRGCTDALAKHNAYLANRIRAMIEIAVPDERSPALTPPPP